MKPWRPLRYRGLWSSFGIYFVWFHSIKRFHAFFLHPRAIIEPFSYSKIKDKLRNLWNVLTQNSKHLLNFKSHAWCRIAWFYKIWLSISWSLGKSHTSKFTILQVTIKLLQWSDEILTIARCPGVWDPNYNIGHTTVPCSCKMVKLKHE